MKKSIHPVLLSLLIAITLAFIFSLSINAQKYQRNGNVFVELKDSTDKSSKKTEYIFVDKNGKKYNVYLSKNGKAYVIKKSKKSGKEYKKYLPEITKELCK